MPEPDPALKHFARAVELDPNSSAGFSQRAEFYLRLDDLEKALSDVNRAIELKPNDTWALALRARIYRAQEKYDDALAILGELRDVGHDYRVPYQMGEVQMLLGKYHEAVESFTDALQLNPGGFHVYKRRATCFARLGNHKRALADLKTCLEINPTETSTFWWIPPSLWDPEGSFREGLLSLLDTAVPRSNDAFAYLRRGKLYADLNEYEKAVADFTDVINKIRHRLKVLPEAPNGRSWLVEAYRARADCYMRIGKMDEAAADLTQAGEVATDSPLALNNLAWSLATEPKQIRDALRAVQFARKAVELSPEPGYWNTLGVAHYRAGNWQEAIQALEKSEKLAPGKDLAFNAFFLAMAHWQLGNGDDARQWYVNGVAWMDKKRPKDEELIHFRGEAAELLGLTPPENTQPVREAVSPASATSDQNPSTTNN